MRPSLAAVVGGLVAAFAAAAHAADVSADWTATTNPNAAGWTYGYTTTLGGALVAYDRPFVVDNVSVWGIANFGPDPNVTHNGTNAPQTVVGSYTLQPGQSAFHPGPDGEFSVYRWTAATGGTYAINALFDDPGNTPTTDVHILVNGVAVFNSFLGMLHPSTGTSLPLVPLAAGSTVDFVVGRGDNLTYFSDTTRLDASILAAPVPEPESALMLLTGLGALAAARRRRTTAR